MRVVLTGGAGFIGSNLAHHWREHRPDDDLVVFDLLTYAGRRESIDDLTGRPGFEFVRGDVADPTAIGPIVQGADLVVHLAAETHNDRAIAGPIPFVRTNVVGTATLLEACRRSDVPRFHHVSTDEVFGALALDDGAVFTDESPYRPRGPYAASKAAADHLVRAWATTYGMRSTISNSGNNFGPFQFPEKLIPLAITRLLRGERVPVYGDGRHVRDWLHVRDHCRALEAIATRGRAGETYLVSAGTPQANLDVLHAICEELGVARSQLVFVADRPGHDRRYALDASRVRDELGWRPEVDFADGLVDTVHWYQAHPDWWSPLVATPPVAGGAAT